MDYTTQRGVLQLVIGACCTCFALSMMVRCHRDGGIRHWPVPWRMVVALWIASLAWSFIAHGVLWLDVRDVTAEDWELVAPLYAVCVMSVWAFWRWLHVERLEAP